MPIGHRMEDRPNRSVIHASANTKLINSNPQNTQNTHTNTDS